MNKPIMNQVSIFDKPANNNGVTMTSPEISELTGKRHDHILRDIRTMLLELHGEGGIPSFEDTHTNPQNGQSYPIFKLPKRETLILVSGYSVAMRAKIIDRWQELETKATAPALPDFNNPAAAARAWADAIELAQAKVIESAQQQARLAIAAPKADALDRISTLSKGSMCITNAAKALQMQPQQLFTWLQEKKWVYRRAGGSGYVGYQGRIQAGHLEHKVTPVERTDGSVRYSEQVLLTAKGLTKLAVDFGAILVAV